MRLGVQSEVGKKVTIVFFERISSSHMRGSRDRQISLYWLAFFPSPALGKMSHTRQVIYLVRLGNSAKLKLNFKLILRFYIYLDLPRFCRQKHNYDTPTPCLNTCLPGKKPDWLSSR